MNEVFQQLKPVIILFLICAGLMFLVLQFTGNTNNTTELAIDTETAHDEVVETPLVADELATYDVDITNRMNPIAIFNTNKGIIEIELFEDFMPITAGNFKKLIAEGYYDGIKFHRIIDGFMIQGGDPNTKTDNVLSYGTGGPGYSIPDEHINGDLLTNVRGTLSMANSGPDSGGSQFFINLSDNTNLDFDKPPLQSKHPVFGRVVAGMDVVDTIAVVETNQRDLPVDAVIIESATIKE